MGFLQDLLDWFVYEAMNLWISIFINLGETVFYIEKGLGNVLSEEHVSGLYQFTSALAVSLILLKVLKKGFMTYILWRDGDPDTPIQSTVINLVLAVATIICFPTLYDWYSEISLWIIEKVAMSSFMMAEVGGWPLIVSQLLGIGLIYGLVFLIYLIMLFILYLQFLKRSAELFILRLGFPLACMGLLDSDNGVFTTTVKTFIQISLTTVTQLFFMMLSITIFLNATSEFVNLFYCIAFCSAAFATPRTLQFILMQTGGGGGGMYKVTSAVHTVSMLRSLIPK